MHIERLCFVKGTFVFQFGFWPYFVQFLLQNNVGLFLDSTFSSFGLITLSFRGLYKQQTHWDTYYASTVFLLTDAAFEHTGVSTQVFTNVIGTIVSPNYPDNYGNDDNRQYEIKAPTKREIVLIFNSFDVEYDHDCSHDSLQVSPFLT